jgi:hypothetical protein
MAYLPLEDALVIRKFQSIHFRALIVKKQEKNDNASYNFFTIKAMNFDMFRPCVGHPQGVDINICKNVDYKYIKQVKMY